MKERPILFSAPMVRAILSGAKTQTRRIVRLDDGEDGPRIVRGRHAALIDPVLGPVWRPHAGAAPEPMPADVLARTFSPYGAPADLPGAGDRLWVRETHARQYFDNWMPAYRADWTSAAGDLAPEPRWTPAIHMRRADARILLDVTDVRVERLQAITEEDARAEGVEPRFCVDVATFMSKGFNPDAESTYRTGFRLLWDEINGDRAAWAANPWVWVVSFKRAETAARAA